MKFSLSFNAKERSRDSRSSLIIYQLRDQILSRKASYKGARAKPTSNEEIQLNLEQVEQLTSIIEKLQLDINYKKRLSASSKGNSGILRHYQANFSYQNAAILVTGDQTQWEDPHVKTLRRFEFLLKYLLKGDQELFDKHYQKIIEH